MYIYKELTLLLKNKLGYIKRYEIDWIVLTTGSRIHIDLIYLLFL